MPTPSSVLVDPLTAMMEGPARSTVRVALAIPMSGPIGLTAPAVLAAAEMAAEEVNDAGGVRGRRLELVTLDAGRPPAEAAADLRRLLSAGAIDAVCGCHTSDVHRALEAMSAGRVPDVFTPPHEGGRRRPGAVFLGQSPHEQLAPVMAQLAHRRALRRWALVGNDYIWPWAVHAAAVEMLREAGTEVVLARLLPFGLQDAQQVVDEIRRSGAQGVLLSLIGRDLATFNRAFAEAGMRSSVVRVSCALDENALLEAGGDDSGELYAAMPWFASDATDDDGQDFVARYGSRWGRNAPTLGAYAHGVYRGVRYLASLAPGTGTAAGPGPTGFRTAAGPDRARLARADGLTLTVVG